MSINPLPSSLRTTALAVAAVALAALSALGARSWLAARDAAAQLTATVAAQKQLLDQADAREQQRDAALAKSLAVVSKAKAAVQTPAQAAAQIPQALPPLPAPISIEHPGEASKGCIIQPFTARTRAGGSEDRTLEVL